MATVVLADDKEFARFGIKGYVSSVDGTRIVGEASNGTDALELVKKLSPDIALLDIEMPGMTGIQVTQKIKELKLPTKVIIMTGHDEPSFLRMAQKAGARAFVTKNAPISVFTNAITAVMLGASYVDPALEGIELDDVEFEELNDRERQVLLLSAAGLSLFDIAKKMYVTKGMISTHRKNIADKFHMENKITALVQFAQQNGIITADEIKKAREEAKKDA